MSTIKRTLAAVATLGFALCALAGQSVGSNTGSRKIQLSEPAVMLGVTVPPGAYMLNWTRERGSEELRIELARGHDTVATGKGRWIESEQPSPYESLVYRADSSGTSGLAEIRFKGSADSILIDADTAVASNDE